MKKNANNYNTHYKLVCGVNRRFVKMPTYDGATPNLYQEWTDDRDSYYVYSYGRIENGMFLHRYIGIGGWTRYKEAKRHNTPLMGNMRDNKYYKIIVCKCNTREETERIERDLISFFGRKDLGTGDLYNLTDGGEGSVGYVHSEEARAKMSKALTGENNPFYGKSHTEETKRKLSEAKKGKYKGENNPMYGRTGQKNPRWKSKNHITDELLFKYFQTCFNWIKEIPDEWDIGESALQRMLKKRYGTSSRQEVQKILAKKLGKNILNHANFLEYLKLHKYEFLQMANYFFGISGEQLQRWCLRTYSKAESSTINGWEKYAKLLELHHKHNIKKRAARKSV